MNKKFRDLSEVLSGRWALLGFFAVFITLAARIAFTRVYPLPYDEGFHFGLIQLYTHHLNPFLAGQPAGADAFGAVARDPSYLYHYLMSFPLRLISLFTHVTIQQVVALRLLNIGFGVGSLALLRKLAMRLGASAVMANLTVLALAVTPVFYDLSGQINYDNILIPLTLLTLLETWSVADIIKRGQVSVARLGRLLALLLLTSLIQYSFLPIMVAICVYLVVLLIGQSHRKSLHWNVNWKSRSTLLAIVLVVVSATLWTQRYGVNLVTYHTPDPQCGTVLSVQDCSQYGPWYRNYLLHESYAAHAPNGLQVGSFTKLWARTMYYGVYSLVHTRSNAVVSTPINAVRIAAKFMLAGSLLYGLLRWHRAKGTGVPWALLGLVGFAYTLALWAQNFSDFRHLGAVVAIQGRYLLLVLPIVYALMARMYTLLAQDIQSAQLLATKAIQRVLYSARQAIRFRTYPFS